MTNQVIVAFTMEQAQALLHHFNLALSAGHNPADTITPTLLDAIDAIESTIVNEHGEEDDNG